VYKQGPKFTISDMAGAYCAPTLVSYISGTTYFLLLL
jgi:hypothetical protein